MPRNNSKTDSRYFYRIRHKNDPVNKETEMSDQIPQGNTNEERNEGMPVWAKWLIGIGIGLAVLLVAFAALAVVAVTKHNNSNVAIGANSPALVNDNPNLWNHPQEEGVMTLNSRIIYSQSGKPNEQTITGQLLEGENLVVTAYRLEWRGVVYDNGMVLVVEGPYDLDAEPIVIRDGAGTLVASGDPTQAKLDSMAVDFARGDRTEDGLHWTYRPWALATIMVGDYHFNNIVNLTEASDTYPNNPPSRK